MSLTLLIILLAATAALLLLEYRRLPTALNLPLKGDIKRESWWLQQYGQAVCTPVAGLLVWELDPIDSGNKTVTLIASVALTSLTCAFLKRLFGRVRPGRDDAGRFLGPSFRLRGGSHRESFPSSHTACAVALTTIAVAVVARALVPGLPWAPAIALGAIAAAWFNRYLTLATIGVMLPTLVDIAGVVAFAIAVSIHGF